MTIDELESNLARIGGCTNSGCYVIEPKGMHTNGGCKCLSDKITATRVVQQYRLFVNSLKKEIK